MNILILGGTGGIGTGLIAHFLKDPALNTLYATFHTQAPRLEAPQLQWHQVDITQEKEIAALAQSIGTLTILINAIGVLHTEDNQPEKSIKQFDSEFFTYNMHINVLPSILLAKYFSKHLASSKATYFISLSARIGSIEDNRLGGWISYRSSKAALNMALKTISIEWRQQLPRCIVIAFHPGTTESLLSQPFQKNVPNGKLFSPEYVALCLTDIIKQAGPKDSGCFFSYDGKTIPW